MMLIYNTIDCACSDLMHDEIKERKVMIKVWEERDNNHKTIFQMNKVINLLVMPDGSYSAINY